MALINKAKNPFKGTEISNAYYRMSDFAFQKGVAGKIGFDVYRSEADRRAGKLPYPKTYENDINVKKEEINIADGIFSKICEVLSVMPDFTEATIDGDGFIMSYEDPYGENHESAYWVPTFVEAQFNVSSVLIRISVYASKTAYEEGESPFPITAQTALGGNIRIGENSIIPQNPELPDFATFISDLDEANGRPILYTFVKGKDKFVDAEDA